MAKDSLSGKVKRCMAAAGLGEFIPRLRVIWGWLWWVRRAARAVFAKTLANRWRRRHYANASERKLEIGPGTVPLAGFETMDAVARPGIDYVSNLEKPLPFRDGTFQIVYASHVLEHCSWFLTGEILRELVRIIEPGGWLEVWVPDGLKICQTIVAAEEGKVVGPPDGWALHNPFGDPFTWAAGRLFYGANPEYPSWHRAVFTPRSLGEQFRRAGLVDLRQLSASEVRGVSHGWVNLGMTGRKPWTTEALPT